MTTISKPTLVVTPAGHLVELPANSVLKPGFRIATRDDIAKAEKAEADRSATETVKGGGPLA